MILHIDFNYSHPFSSYNFYIDTGLVAPVTVLAASYCIFSNSCFSCWLLSSQITSENLYIPGKANWELYKLFQTYFWQFCILVCA